ncbi:MAG: hypothetical protein WA738_18310 [Candidatus Angelobacter sp.]
MAYECDRQAEAKPAFSVKIREAIWLVQAGLANFIHRNNAIQLAFDRLGNLRDMSCLINPEVIFGYTCGVSRPRVAVNQGWDTPLEVTMISELQAAFYAQTMFRFI